MGNSDRPNGSLMTGAVGGFLNGAAYLIVLFVIGVGVIMALSGAGRVGMSDEAGGGLLLLAFVLLLAGGICNGIGWFGYGKVRGSTSALAGTFSLLVTVSLVLVVVAGLAKSLTLGEITLYALFGTAALNGILGGIAHLSGADRDPSKPSGGLDKAAGAVLLIGGIGAALMLVLIIAKMFDSTGLLQAAFYGGLGGLGVGHILSGVSMIGARG